MQGPSERCVYYMVLWVAEKSVLSNIINIMLASFAELEALLLLKYIQKQYTIGFLTNKSFASFYIPIYAPT